MIKSYRDAIAPKLNQVSIIKSMRDIVNQYCPDQHVFELMINPEKVIKCEELARKAIGENTSQVYSSYHKNIAGPFLVMILQDWKALANAQAKSPSMYDVQELSTRPSRIR
jgi:hypothetical protein